MLAWQQLSDEQGFETAATEETVACVVVSCGEALWSWWWCSAPSASVAGNSSGGASSPRTASPEEGMDIPAWHSGSDCACPFRRSPLRRMKGHESFIAPPMPSQQTIANTASGGAALASAANTNTAARTGLVTCRLAPDFIG
ncbi:MAG TPA: hypothetical protein VM864_03460 [Pyrinomonadaceae bacterium]|nr:hypothetical protein [Pyrinomonadaceae bacterium]